MDTVVSEIFILIFQLILIVGMISFVVYWLNKNFKLKKQQNKPIKSICCQ